MRRGPKLGCGRRQMSVSKEREEETPMKALIVDSNWISRAGLSQLLYSINKACKITEAANFAEAMAALSCQPFSICLVDPGVGDTAPLDGLKALRQTAPATPIVVVTERAARRFALQAVEIGAQGFILKHANMDEIRRSVERVMAGEIALPSNFNELGEGQNQTSSHASGMSKAGLSFSARSDNPVAALTARQRDVLSHIATGKRNAEIGKLLEISPRTVQIHVSTILKLLGVGNRTEAALLARKHGIGA